MDLTFLCILARGLLPRAVPPGPAFEQVLSYQAAGLLIAYIPPVIRTRLGSFRQHDAVATAITGEGWAALQKACDQRQSTEIAGNELGNSSGLAPEL